MRLLNSSKRKHEWLSRKLWFSVFAVLMLFLGLHAAIDSTAFAAVYSAFVGGVVSISGLFLAGNVIAGKLSPAASAKTEPTSEETPG